MAIQDGSAVFELGRLVLVNELDDYVKNVTVDNDELIVSKGDNTNTSISVPYSLTTQGTSSKDLGGYTYDKISVIRDLFYQELSKMKVMETSYFTIGLNLDVISTNWAINWDATMSPWGMVKCVMTKLGGNTSNIYASIELTGYNNLTMVLLIANDVWKTPEYVVRTYGGNNIAHSWRIKNGELVIDGNYTSVDKITIGGTALNYNGNGFKYIFDNGKNALADIEIHTVESATGSSDKAASTKFVQAAIVAALAAKGL